MIGRLTFGPEKLVTPFFLFDEARFRHNVETFRAALTAHHPHVVIGYSIKTNYLPQLCSIARDMGCHAEAVSTMELQLAQRLEFEPGKLIFNGPMKTPEDLALSVEMGGYIHLDSLEQVRMLLELPANRRHAARVGLRVNVDLAADPEGRTRIAQVGVVPRFGLPLGDIETAVAMIREAGLKVVSLHGHATSSDRKPENYTRIAELLLDVAKRFALEELELLDVGGGFSGSLPEIWNVHDSPDFADYADAIFSPLTSDPWFLDRTIHVGIEPGMAIVADCLSYVTEIVSRKRIAGRDLLVVDGNYFDVRPTLHRKPLPAVLIGAASQATRTISEVTHYVVTGSTCMERDILLEDFQAPPSAVPGDRIRIDNVGAYTLVLSPSFINFACAVYGQRADGSIYVMRRAQSFDDFFATYVFQESD